MINTINLANEVRVAFELCYGVQYSNQAVHQGIARLYHGIAHATRVLLFTRVAYNLYLEAGDPAAREMTSEDLYCIQIAGLYHDAGRQADGPDRPEWEQASAQACFDALQQQNIPTQKALRAASAIVNKDYNGLSGFHQLSLDTENKIQIRVVNPGVMPKKDSWAKLVHEADALDVMRDRSNFDYTRLDFYQDYSRDNQVLQQKLLKLISEVRALINLQGDECGKLNVKVKKNYEHRDAFDAVIKDFSRFPILSQNVKINHLSSAAIDGQLQMQRVASSARLTSMSAATEPNSKSKPVQYQDRWTRMPLAVKIILGILMAISFPISLPIFFTARYFEHKKIARQALHTKGTVAGRWAQPRSSDFASTVPNTVYTATASDETRAPLLVRS